MHFFMVTGCQRLSLVQEQLLFVGAVWREGRGVHCPGGGTKASQNDERADADVLELRQPRRRGQPLPVRRALLLQGLPHLLCEPRVDAATRSALALPTLRKPNHRRLHGRLFLPQLQGRRERQLGRRQRRQVEQNETAET